MKKSQEFYGLSPWKRKIIPKRVTTVGCNGPTKRNVTLEGMVKDITQGLWQKFHTKRRNIYMTLLDVLSWKERIYEIPQEETHLKPWDGGI